MEGSECVWNDWSLLMHLVTRSFIYSTNPYWTQTVCQAPGNPVVGTLVTVLASIHLQAGKMVIRLAIKTEHDDIIIGKKHLLFVRRFLLPYQSIMDFRMPLLPCFFPFLFSSRSVPFSHLYKPGKWKANTLAHFLESLISFYLTDITNVTYVEWCTWKKGWGPSM